MNGRATIGYAAIRAAVRTLAAVMLLVSLAAAPAVALAEGEAGTTASETQGTQELQAQAEAEAQVPEPVQGEQGEPESESDETEQVHDAEAQGDVAEVDVARLVAGDIDLNGETVTFTGEVVGEPIVADRGHLWLQVDDGGVGIAVFLRDSLAEQIVYYGGYDFTGDTISITGIYHFDCAAHQGDLDVHAVKIDVVKSGAPIEHGNGLDRLWPAVIIVVAGGIAGIVYWRLRERMR